MQLAHQGHAGQDLQSAGVGFFNLKQVYFYLNSICILFFLEYQFRLVGSINIILKKINKNMNDFEQNSKISR